MALSATAGAAGAGGATKIGSPGYPTVLVLATFLVHSGQMPGFEVTSQPHGETGAAQYVKRVDGLTGKTAQKKAHGLTSAGFISGVSEVLSPQKTGSNAGGLALVLLFNTAAGARRYQSVQYSEFVNDLPKHTKVTTFQVGIHGATAYTALGQAADPGSSSSAFFTSGRCLAIVGDFLNGTFANTAASVKTAAINVAANIGKGCQ
jgi:hypothetical protein